MATSWFGLSYFFKRKKKICSSVLVKSKCSKSKITCQGGKCCHWQSSIPQIPRPNESLKRLAFGAKSCLLPEKGFLNRTDCKLKIRSTVTYIPSFLLLNLDRTDRKLLWDNRRVCSVMSFPWSPNHHQFILQATSISRCAELEDLCWWCDVFYVHITDINKI